MKRRTPEKTLVHNRILRKMAGFILSKDIIWFQTLAAESDINCLAGTPDIISIVNCKNGKIAILFLECKRPSKKKPSLDDLRFEQRLFFDDMEGKPMILCVVINDPGMLWAAIKKARNL